MHGAVTGDTGVVYQHLDRSEVGLDRGDPAMDSVKIRYVELVGLDSGTFAEFCRGGVVSGIVGCHGVAGILELNTDVFPDSAGAACYESYSTHVMSP